MAKEKVNSILKRADKYLRNGKTDAAITEYKKIIKKFPDNLKIRRLLGDLAYKTRDNKEAIHHFNWIAEYFLRDGDVNKATAMYKRITRIDPDYDEAYFHLSELYSKQGLIVEAKQIYLNLAEKFKRQKKLKKALDMYKKILEFDPNNMDMRMVLAKNYLSQGHEKQAFNEYLNLVDILVEQKNYSRALEVLNFIREEIQSEELKKQSNERIIFCLKKQGKNSETIEYIENLLKEDNEDTSILKTLGELYLEQDEIDKAEKVFIQIAGIDPDEIENLIDLSKVYLNRGEYERTFKLFSPIIEKYEKENQFEKASSLLRLIIAANNTYLPALIRLAKIYKASGKKSNLIALYESMLIIYENQNEIDKYKEILETLIQLSDDPFSYEEKMDQISGKVKKEENEKKVEEKKERQKEFIHFNIRMADEAIGESDFVKALKILKKSKDAFPKNLEVRKKIYDIYTKTNEDEKRLREGKVLIELYQKAGMKGEYEELLTTLSLLEPGDEKLLDFQKNESTSINIDFDTDDLEVDISGESASKNIDQEDELLVLDVEALDNSDEKSSYYEKINELLKNNDLVQAQKTFDELKMKFSDSLDSLELNTIIERINNLKVLESKKPDQLSNEEITFGTDEAKVEEERFLLNDLDSSIERDKQYKNKNFELSSTGEDSNILQNKSDSKFNIEVNFDYLDNGKIKLDDSKDSFAENLEIDMSDSKRIAKKEVDEKIKNAVFNDSLKNEEEIDGEADTLFDSQDSAIIRDIQEETSELSGNLKPDGEVFLSEPINEEDHHQDDFVKNEFVLQTENQQPDNLSNNGESKLENPSDDEFDIEIDGEIDSNEEKKTESQTNFISESKKENFFDELEIDDKLFENLESQPVNSEEQEEPFDELEKQNVEFDLESDEILESDDLFFNEDKYFDLSQNASEEIDAINKCVAELEKQKTSTVEKNMMEIFEEFKKGVNEKIGNKDFDTRYNLGIAYKEMGLIEEAIHEFLISSKSEEKFFDSAGLLGICFKEKGLLDEALNWFQKALESKDRKEEEYLSIKYEILLTYKLKDDKASALKIAQEIAGINPDFRDIKKIIGNLS